MWHRAVTLAAKRLLIAAGLCLQSLLSTSVLIRVHWEWGEHYSGNYPDVTWRGEKKVKKHEEIKAETSVRLFLPHISAWRWRIWRGPAFCVVIGLVSATHCTLSLKNQFLDLVGYNVECSPPEGGTWVHSISSNAALGLSLTEPLPCGSSVGLDAVSLWGHEDIKVFRWVGYVGGWQGSPSPHNSVLSLPWCFFSPSLITFFCHLSSIGSGSSFPSPTYSSGWLNRSMWFTWKTVDEMWAVILRSEG